MNGIQGDAEGEQDDDSHKRLLAAAKVLADATAKLVDAAKVTFLHLFCIVNFNKNLLFVAELKLFFLQFEHLDE